MNFFQKILQKAAPVMSAVQSLFFYVIIFSIVGYYVDKKFDTFPFLFILCLLIGLISGFYQIYYLVNFKNMLKYISIKYLRIRIYCSQLEIFILLSISFFTSETLTLIWSMESLNLRVTESSLIES